MSTHAVSGIPLTEGTYDTTASAPGGPNYAIVRRPCCELIAVTDSSLTTHFLQRRAQRGAAEFAGGYAEPEDQSSSGPGSGV